VNDDHLADPKSISKRESRSTKRRLVNGLERQSEQPKTKQLRPNHVSSFLDFLVPGQMSYRISEKIPELIGSLLLGLLLAGAVIPAANAQQNSSLQKPVSMDGDKSGNDDAHKPFIEMEEEMRAKRAIKFAEQQHQENLERARDLSSLSSAIVASFKQKHELAGEELKKLEKVEKLAKGIRRAAGGSEDEVELEKRPTDIASALDMLSDLSKSLKDKVERTPKHVISAAVIDEANVLLELVRILRNLPPKV